MLEIQDLVVTVADNDVLHGVSLQVPKGQVHAIMGPNGSGKSSLGKALMGLEGYPVVRGQASLAGQSLLEMTPDERQVLGFFLGYQYPVSIPGVNNMVFLRTAVNAVRRKRGQDELSAGSFLKHVKELAEVIGFDEQFLKRDLNEGFSGGEKKRNELLQCLLLEPRVAWLDELDSGLDIDALRQVSTGIEMLRQRGTTVVLVTHYKRLLEHVVPDRVHVLMGGRLIHSAGAELVDALEAKGYDWLRSGEAL